MSCLSVHPVFVTSAVFNEFLQAAEDDENENGSVFALEYRKTEKKENICEKKTERRNNEMKL